MPRRPETQMPRARFQDEYKYPDIIWNFNKLAQMPRRPETQKPRPRFPDEYKFLFVEAIWSYLLGPTKVITIKMPKFPILNHEKISNSCKREHESRQSDEPLQLNATSSPLGQASTCTGYFMVLTEE